MLRLPAPTIRTKLVAMVVLAVVAAQAAVAGILVWQEANRYGAAKRDSMLAAAHAIASAAGRPAAERNRAEIVAVLRAVGRISGLLYAAVEDLEGREIADLGATEQLASDARLRFGGSHDPTIFDLLGSRSAEALIDIVQGGVAVGRLRIISDTADLVPRLRAAVATTIYGTLAALAVALLLVLLLQRSITRPLTELTRTMSRVGGGHDYSVELKTASRDEVGVLIRGFNTMLAGIRERDGQLARHREHLEAEVVARTGYYRVARDAAESANHAKSTFLATMSHEIRTPMNGILVMAELLAAGNLPPRSRRYAEVIARSGQGLVAIINDILDFSKIEAGKLDVERLAVGIEECAGNVVSLFAERAQSKGLDIAVLIETDVPRHAAADPVRLNQVLGNLVNNALKFTEKGHVLLRVSRDAREPNRVRFAVTDTGIGIPADKIGSIFGAFSQADQSTTRRFGGTGLGLSIAQKLVAAMGGEIAVESVEGQGSTFYFTLDCVDCADVPLWPCVAGCKRALVDVEGAAATAAISHYLTQAGYEIAQGNCAQFEGHADLVIASIGVLQRLERRAGGADCAILALAHLGETGFEALQTQGHASAMLEQPLARGDLAGLIEDQAAGRAIRSAHAAVRREDAGYLSFAGARVLVVDDAAVNREVAVEALRGFGIFAEVLCDGAEAVEACARERFDLVLMDGSMPGLDGFEATRLIRAAEEQSGRARQPIVALTAHVIGSAAMAWKASGMDGVLHKPFAMNSMGECLAAHLQPSRDAAISLGLEKAEPESEPEEAILDPAIVAQLREMAALGRTDFVTRVTGLYREHAPPAFEAIEAAANSRDPAAMAKAAHALKSMSFNTGARQVSQIAAALEQAARDQGSAGAPAQIEALRAALAQALAELQQLAA